MAYHTTVSRVTQETESDALYADELRAVRSACRRSGLEGTTKVRDSLNLTLELLGVGGGVDSGEPVEAIASLRAELEAARDERDMAVRARRRAEDECDSIRRSANASRTRAGQLRAMQVASARREEQLLEAERELVRPVFFQLGAVCRRVLMESLDRSIRELLTRHASEDVTAAAAFEALGLPPTLQIPPGADGGSASGDGGDPQSTGAGPSGS